MDQVTQKNAAMVEQTTAAAHSLGHETTELTRRIARFNLGSSQPSKGSACKRLRHESLPAGDARDR